MTSSSPASSSARTPTTPHSATAGWERTPDSTSKEEIFSPRRRNASFTRSTKKYQPSASRRSEEHTSELQSLMRISYAVFCLNKKKNNDTDRHLNISISKLT